MLFKDWWKTYVPKENIDMLHTTARDAFNAGILHAAEIAEKEYTVLKRNNLDAHATGVSGVVSELKRILP